MKFCLPIPCFFPGDFTDGIRQAAALGFRAVETYQWQSLDLPRVADTLHQTGVTLLSICTTEFRMTDPAYRGAFVAGVAESCRAAKTLGASFLITQVGQDTGRPRTRQHAAILAALREARPILEESGITLLMEPLNRHFDHPGYYLTRSEEGFALVREAESPHIKLVYDIYHQQISEGNILPNVTNHLHLIGHLHAAGHPGRHELQLGETDYRNVFAAIDQAGYTGYCGLEYRPTLPPAESLRETLRLYGAPADQNAKEN